MRIKIDRGTKYKVLLVIYTCFVLLFDIDSINYQTACTLTVIDLTIIFISIYKSGNIRFDDARLFFVIITILFTFGQNIAFFIGRESILTNPDTLYQSGFTEYELCYASVFTIVSFNFLFLGLYHGANLDTSCNYDIKPSEDSDYQSRVLAAKYVSFLLIAVSVIPAIIYLYYQIILYLSVGYGEISQSQMSGLMIRLHYLFIPGVFMNYIAQKLENKKAVVNTVIIFCFAFFNLLIGDRGGGLALLLCFLFLSKSLRMEDVTEKKKNILNTVIVIVFALALAFLVPMIKYYRIAYSGSVSEAITSSFKYTIENNPVLDILLETGANLRILPLTIRKIRFTDFAYGETYLEFFKKMFPSFLGFKYKYGTLAKWLIGTTAYQTHGFSIWAEAYLNFGRYGCLVFYVIGHLMRKLLWTGRTKNVIQIFLATTSLFFFCDIVRRSISEFGYNVMYDIILPAVGIYLVSTIITRRGNK